MSKRDEASVPETPWEFLPGDDEVDSYADDRPAAEDSAMHIREGIDPPLSRRWRPEDDAGIDVHYLDDEEPELPSGAMRPEPSDTTAEVDELLVRQHYLPPDD